MRLGGLPPAQGWWLPRAIRGAWLDRNPLRRGVDRLETCLLVGLFIVLAAGAPFAVQAAGRASYAGALQARQEQQATRHEVQAVLTSQAPPISGYALNTSVLTEATWTSASGVRRSGVVPAPPGSPKGSAVTVWTDDGSGYLDSPPLTMAEAAGQADAAMVGAAVGLGLLYLAGAGVIEHVLHRRRMAAWEADWLATAPAWNRQRW
jgi:hypothetical protein